MNRRHRVVEVLTRTERAVRVGSGYAIADDLVLTAGHVVGPDGVSVRLLDGTTLDAEVAWLGVGVGDAALLRVPAAPWRGRPDSGGMRWGKVTGDRAVACRAWGFPKAQTMDGARDIEPMEGTVNASGAIRSERYDVNINTPTLLPLPGDDSGWQGMSGAALFGPGLQLLGVILADPKMYASTRLQALPVMRLLADNDFAALVEVGRHDLEEVADHGDVRDLDAYILAAYQERPSRMEDFELLQAKFGIVPFLGRDAEQDQLHDWCTSGNRFSVAVITGDGGAGKTRLAAQLCDTMAKDGWQAGFADEKSLGGAGNQVELAWPTVLVIDYPDRMSDAVVGLIGRLGRPRRGPKLRILLVDRAPGGVTDQLTWWRKLNRDTDGLVHRSTRLSIQLAAGRLDPAGRHGHATEAWAKFTDSTREMPALDLTDDGYGNPLKLHIAVLQAARGEVHSDADSVVAGFLAREERRWVDRLPRHFIEDLTDLRAFQAVALATMTAPAPTVVAQLLTAVPGLADPVGFAVERRTRIAEWLAELFPGGDRIAPISPDLIAEELLAKTRGLAGLVLAIHDNEECTAVHKARMLDALRLAADRVEVREALHKLLVERLPALIEAAEQDSFLARQIDTVIPLCVDDELRAASAAAIGNRRRTTDPDLAQLYSRIAELAVAWHDTQPPDIRRADILTDLVAYRSVLDTVAKTEAERAWADCLSLGAEPKRLAKAAYNLGTCFGRAGQRELARDWLTEAVRRYDQVDGDLQARIDAWTNLAVARADLGDQRGALEACIAAIKVYGQARGSNYFLVQFTEPLEVLVKSLTTSPVQRKLLDSARDSYYPPAGVDETWWQADNYMLVALPLTRLVARLVPGLADRTPEKLRNALLPVLFGRFAKQQAGYAAENYAEFLRMLSLDLLKQKLYAEAIAPLLESVSLLRKFAPTDLYMRTRLAEGLDRLALLSWQAKKFDDASRYAMDAIAAYRDIVMTDPDSIEPTLARLHNRLAENLEEAQRMPAALAARREAIAIYRRLPARRADLAQSCLDLASLLVAREHLAEAAQLLEEAAALFADLRTTDPKFGRQQSDALMLLGSLPVGPEQIVDAAEQAVALKMDLVAAGEAELIEYVDALISLSAALGNTGRIEDAYGQVTQAADLAREVLAENPADGALALGTALSLKARWALGVGRYEEALVTAPEALAAIAGVPDTEPLARMTRADALSTLSACMVADQRPEEALSLAGEAVALYEDLIRAGETNAGIELSYAMALVSVGQGHMLAGRPAEGLAAAVTAREAVEEFTVDSTLVERTLAAASLVEGGCLTGLNRPAEAVAALTTADELLARSGVTDRYSYLLRINAITSRAGSHLVLGRPDLAAELTGQALAMLNDVADHQGQPAEVARTSAIRATAMIQLGDAQGAYEASSAALAIYRQSPPSSLVERSLLASALSSGAASVNALGDPTQALAMYEESIVINREVADRLPDGRVTLAGVLADYGTCLFGLGDLEAAAAATGEAIAEMRASGALRHAPVVAFYTSVLMTHVQCLMQLGEPFDEIIDEAVTFLRDIPDARLPLARALGLQAVGRNTQGAPGVIEIAGESIQLYREFDGTPDVLPAIASLLGILGQHLAFADRLPEAVAALRESGARFAAVTEILPQLVFERIDVERNLVFCVGDLGDFPEALQHATVALDLMRPLAGENPHLIPILVEMLEAQRDLFADLGHDNEAAQAAAEARQWAAPK